MAAKPSPPATDVTVFVVRIRGLRSPTTSFNYMTAKDQCYLSPNTKFAAGDKVAWLADRETAERWVAALNPVMLKRHGAAATLSVEPSVLLAIRLESHSGKQTMAKVTRDTAHVLERIRTGNFAPNKAPDAAE